MKLTDLEQSRWLKEKGAPQDTQFSYFTKDLAHAPQVFHRSDYLWPHNGLIWHEDCSAYDLESLIEWLGDDFESLKKPYVVGGKYCAEQGGNGRCYFGETALESVYNLCVAVKGGK